MVDSWLERLEIIIFLANIILKGANTLYRPKFCAECGTKLVSTGSWKFLITQQYCSICNKRYRWSNIFWLPSLSLILLSLGWLLGYFSRSSVSPPLIIERTATSSEETKVFTGTATASNAQATTNELTDPTEMVSICGARTKKGTPCSRRVRGKGRCWQHKGLRAMLPEDKLIVHETE
jgi:hypothetical protein